MTLLVPSELKIFETVSDGWEVFEPGKPDHRVSAPGGDWLSPLSLKEKKLLALILYYSSLYFVLVGYCFWQGFVVVVVVIFGAYFLDLGKEFLFMFMHTSIDSTQQK